MDNEQRIEQFKVLCADDPTNDVAWFSLGGALRQAGRHAEAAEAYRECISINEQMSKAYQLAGQSLIEAGDEEAAAEVLETGYRIAAGRGDLMPKNAMADLLRKLGREAPVAAGPGGPRAEPEGDFVCGRTGKRGHKMAKPPFRGPVGEWIQENIARETFDEWIALGTKVINELKLDLSRDDHDAVYDAAMRGYLGLTDEQYRSLTDRDPPEPPSEYREPIRMILDRLGDVEEFQGRLDARLER